jgi:ribosomal-protein-alanine N-acetyltransferase
METNITLRPLTINDIDDQYCDWYNNDDGHLDYFSGSGRRFNKDTLLNERAEGIRTGKWFYYIIESDRGEKIGNVKLGPVDLKNKTSDLVCLIGNRNFRGKGLASKAIGIASKIAFEVHDIRRLHGGMYARNTSSIKAYTKAGWFIEGTFRGYYLYNDMPQDRICVACLNPIYFPK